MKSRNNRGALASLSLCMLLPSLGTSIANVALPTLAQAFNASFQAVQWVVIAYLIAITSLVVIMGRLGDLTERRRLLIWGVCLFTAASLLCALAPALWILIAARAVQGVGAAIIMALTLTFVGETVPKAKTGSAMGLLGTMSAIGTALGPSLGGVLIAGLGWRAIFLINVPLGILIVVLARRYLPLFVRIETRAASPLIRMALFRNPVLSAGFATSLMVSTVLMATMVVGPFYLALTLKLNTAEVGLVMSVGPVVAALTGIPAGRMADRVGTHRMTVAGLIVIATGAFALSVLPATLGVAGFLVPIIFVTGGYAVFQTANNTGVMAAFGTERRGVISGLLNLSRNLGLISGASFMGAVFALTGMRATFAVAGTLIMVAMAITIAGAMKSRARDPLTGTPDQNFAVAPTK